MHCLERYARVISGTFDHKNALHPTPLLPMVRSQQRYRLPVSMSQQCILELSTASARSKGQALRRQQPALTEEDRKARRKLSRLNRRQLKQPESKGSGCQTA